MCERTVSGQKSSNVTFLRLTIVLVRLDDGLVGFGVFDRRAGACVRVSGEPNI